MVGVVGVVGVVVVVVVVLGVSREWRSTLVLRSLVERIAWPGAKGPRSRVGSTNEK